MSRMPFNVTLKLVHFCSSFLSIIHRQCAFVVSYQIKVDDSFAFTPLAIHIIHVCFFQIWFPEIFFIYRRHFYVFLADHLSYITLCFHSGCVVRTFCPTCLAIVVDALPCLRSSSPPPHLTSSKWQKSVKNGENGHFQAGLMTVGQQTLERAMAAAQEAIKRVATVDNDRTTTINAATQLIQDADSARQVSFSNCVFELVEFSGVSLIEIGIACSKFDPENVDT